MVLSRENPELKLIDMIPVLLLVSFTDTVLTSNWLILCKSGRVPQPHAQLRTRVKIKPLLVDKLPVRRKQVPFHALHPP